MATTDLRGHHVVDDDLPGDRAAERGAMERGHRRDRACVLYGDPTLLIHPFAHLFQFALELVHALLDVFIRGCFAITAAKTGNLQAA